MAATEGRPSDLLQRNAQCILSQNTSSFSVVPVADYAEEELKSAAECERLPQLNQLELSLEHR